MSLATWSGEQGRTFSGILRNVSERKRAEEKLQKSEQTFKAVVDQLPAAIALKDNADRYTLVKRTFTNWFVKGGADIVGRTTFDLYPDDVAEELRAVDRRVMETGETVTQEITEPFVDGAPHILLITKFPIRDAAGEIIALGSVETDITERKNAEDELRVAKAEADAANRAKSDFLSSMSHELRTPLNAIIGYSEFVSEDADDPLNEEQMECIGQVMKAGRHLLELINDVLDLSTIEIGAVSLTMEPVIVTEVVKECVELNASFASRHGIALEDKVSGADLPPIRVDRTRFKQVVLNILSNAVKYNRENGTITIEQSQPSAQTVRVSVTDTGEGIPEDHLENIFTPSTGLVQRKPTSRVPASV